jgi:hypothetical protein
MIDFCSLFDVQNDFMKYKGTAGFACLTDRASGCLVGRVVTPGLFHFRGVQT